MFFLHKKFQRPHVFDYLRTKHHQHNVVEARDNQTMKQHSARYACIVTDERREKDIK